MDTLEDVPKFIKCQYWLEIYMLAKDKDKQQLATTVIWLGNRAGKARWKGQAGQITSSFADPTHEFGSIEGYQRRDTEGNQKHCLHKN